MGFSSCSRWALEPRLRGLWLRGTWDLPGPGIGSVPPALAGRFFTTEPPGNPLPYFVFSRSDVGLRICIYQLPVYAGAAGLGPDFDSHGAEALKSTKGSKWKGGMRY